MSAPEKTFSLGNNEIVISPDYIPWGSKADSSTYNLYLRNGLEYLCDENYDNAIEQFDLAAKTQETKSWAGDAYYFLAVAYAVNGDVDNAIEIMCYSIDYLGIHSNEHNLKLRAMLYELKGETEKAQSDYSEIEDNKRRHDEFKRNPELHIHTESVHFDAWGPIDPLEQGKREYNTEEGRKVRNEGDQNLSDGDYNEAIKWYSKYVELCPNDWDAYRHLGKAYQYNGMYEKAVETFTKEIACKPDFHLAYLDRGTAYWKLKEYDKSVADYNQAEIYAPDLAHVFYFRAETEFDMGDYDATIRDCMRGIGLSPGWEGIYYLLIKAYLKLNDYDNALIVHRNFAAHTIFENDYDRIAKIYELKGDVYNMRLNLMRHWIRREKTCLEDDIYGYYHRVDINTPIKSRDYTREITQDSDDWRWYLKSAEKYGTTSDFFYGDLKDCKKAIDDITAALRINPQSPQAYYYRAKTFENMGEYDNAISDYSRLLGLYPQNKTVYKYRGRLHLKNGDFDNAINDIIHIANKSYDPVGDLNDPQLSFDVWHNIKNAGPHAHAAFILQLWLTYFKTPYGLGNNFLDLAKEKQEKLITGYTEIIKKNPCWIAAYLFRALAYLGSGDKDRAVEDYQRVISISPDFIKPYLELGDIFRGNADYDQAIKYYSQAIDLDPESWEAYAGRCLTYHKTGETEKSDRDFKRAEEITKWWDVYLYYPGAESDLV